MHYQKKLGFSRINVFNFSVIKLTCLSPPPWLFHLQNHARKAFLLHRNLISTDGLSIKVVLLFKLSEPSDLNDFQSMYSNFLGVY